MESTQEQTLSTLDAASFQAALQRSRNIVTEQNARAAADEQARAAKAYEDQVRRFKTLAASLMALELADDEIHKVQGLPAVQIPFTIHALVYSPRSDRSNRCEGLRFYLRCDTCKDWIASETVERNDEVAARFDEAMNRPRLCGECQNRIKDAQAAYTGAQAFAPPSLEEQLVLLVRSLIRNEICEMMESRGGDQ